MHKKIPGKISSGAGRILYILILIIIFISLDFIFLAGCRNGGQDKRVYEVKQDRLDIFVEADCSTSSRKQVSLGFEIAGKLEYIIDEGASVKKGEVLAGLDPGDLENKLSIIKQQIEIKKKEKELARIDRQNSLDKHHIIVQLEELQERYDIEKTDGAFTVWQDSLEYKSDVEEGTQVGSDIVVDEPAQSQARLSAHQAETDYRLSEIQRGISYWQLLEQRLLARNSIDRADSSIELLEENILLLEKQEHKIRDNMEKTEIISPVDGTVVKTMAEEGEIAAPASPLLILKDLDDIEVIAQVDEEDMGEVTVGQDVEIYLDAYPGITFKGTVSRISSNVIDIAGVKYFPVHIQIDRSSPDEVSGILPGFSGDIKILTDFVTGKLVIPNDYIKVRGNQNYVFIIDSEGQISEIEINTGKKNINFTVVEEGLSEGDRIVYPEDMEE